MRLRTLFMLLILIFSLSLASALQNEDVVVLQAYPNPTFPTGSEDVYLIFWNNGSDPIYPTQIIYEMSRINEVDVAEIGNNIHSFTNITSNISVEKNKQISMNLTDFAIQPDNYVELHYSYSKRGAAETIKQEESPDTILFFNDSSNKTITRPLTIHPFATVGLSFEIFEESLEPHTSYSSAANLTETFILNIKEYKGDAGHKYNGTVIVNFPEGFNPVPVEGGHYFANCSGDICSCKINNSLCQNFGTCYINITIPLTFVYEFYAEATGVDSGGGEMKTKSEFLIKSLKRENKPPKILGYDITPNVLYEVKPITIFAEVIDESGVEYVRARIEGLRNTTISLTKINSVYEINYTLDIDGEYSVFLIVEDIYGNRNESYIGEIQFLVPETPPLAKYCRNIHSIGLVSKPSILNVNKMHSLMNSNYFCVKNILGLWNYDFYIELIHPNGSHFVLDGEEVVYGKMPYSTAKVMVFRQNLIVPSETLTSVILKLYIWV